MMEWKEFVLGVFYPRCCPVCGKIVKPIGKKICSSCQKRLVYVKEPRCKHCSKPVLLEEQEYCYDCANKKYAYTSGKALFEYNQEMRNSMSAYKFYSKKEYADFYVEELLLHYEKWIRSVSPDVIIPIPIHRAKRNDRGYNQAELLATRLGKALQIPVLKKCLLRVKNTIPQKLLDHKQRFKNLNHAFCISPHVSRYDNLPMPQKVLLVDDIYTTGATINLCAEVLKQEGIQKVYFLTVCIGKGF